VSQSNAHSSKISLQEIDEVYVIVNGQTKQTESAANNNH